MQLTRKQFDILTLLKRIEASLSQRDIAAKTNMAVGSVNNTMAQLKDFNYILSDKITDQGMLALEPYRVQRAVFIAAGLGARLIPITLNTPKPLVRVKGVRIIDTMLDAVVDAGIKEIVIVRGYLSEQFDQLLYKYPNIKFLENPLYNETNNISSAMCARHLFKNAYIFDGDLIFYNKALVTPYQYCSNYVGVPVKVTDNWCLESKNGVITRMRRGGENCHVMFGFSYWTESDGVKLAEHIKRVYETPGGKERFWDQVPLECFAAEYQVQIRQCSFDDITEIDTYNDLKRLDRAYA